MQPGDACTACAMHEVPDSTPHHTPRPGVCCRLAFAEVLERSRQLVAILLEGPPRARNVDELLLKESMDVIGARAGRPARGSGVLAKPHACTFALQATR